MLATELSNRYRPMPCRACGETISPDSAVIHRLMQRRSFRAPTRRDLIYTCACGMSYSNAVAELKRKQITSTPELNVPEQVLEGLSGVLGQSANVRNRASKAEKFCSEASEDAVSWTVFRWLAQCDRLGVLRDAADDSSTPDLLLWGTPVAGEQAQAAALALNRVCLELGESKEWLSEPDAIVVWPDLLIVVEAKYQSGNQPQCNHENFGRYYRSDLFEAAEEVVAATGFYELTRNWRIGSDLAGRLSPQKDFLLVNLGPQTIAATADEFRGLLKRNAQRRFTHRTWSSLLEPSGQEVERWFVEFARLRELDRM